MRQFTFEGRIFSGFDRDFSTPHRLVLCQDEDVVVAFAVDGTDIVDEIDNLLRYFTASESKCKIIGTYLENGFRGFLCANQFVSGVSRFQ